MAGLNFFIPLFCIPFGFHNPHTQTFILQNVCLGEYYQIFFLENNREIWTSGSSVLIWNSFIKVLDSDYLFIIYYLWDKITVLQSVSPVGSSGTKLLIMSPWSADCWCYAAVLLFCFAFPFPVNCHISRLPTSAARWSGVL